MRPSRSHFDERARHESKIIERHLRAYRSDAHTEVELLRFRERPAARLYWYALHGGSRPVTLVVKVPGRPADADKLGPGDRPRLAPIIGLAEKYVLECNALRLIETHFTALADARFSFVPVVGKIDELKALITESVEGEPMNPLGLRALLRPALGQRRRRYFLRAVTNAGAWLREFHQVPRAELRARQGERFEWIDLVGAYCSYLGTALADPTSFASLRDKLVRAADRRFPAQMPVALNHGDYAMRNILVKPRSTIVVLDTSAHWRAPIYEDLAKFSLAIQLGRAQVYSQGLALDRQVSDWANRLFMEAYFGSRNHGAAEVDLYATLLVLDKWTYELALGGTSPASALQGRLRNRWFRRVLSTLVRTLAVSP